MGTPDFAQGILQALLDSGYDVKAVFTQPDRPKGRKGALAAPPVKTLALEHGIAVYQPEKIREEENAKILEEIAPDVIVVAAFGQIIPKRILDIPAYGCVNVHASLLPRWRGAAPIQWSILTGEEETGVTIMQMGEGLDNGDIITQSKIRIRADETGDSLFDRLMTEGQKLLITTLDMIGRGEATFTPQPEKSTTPYAKMLTRMSGKIDWTKSAREIERMVRALNSWPGTFTYLDGKLLKIWNSAVCEETCKSEDPKEVKTTEGADAGSKAPTLESGEGCPDIESSPGKGAAVPGCVTDVSKNGIKVLTGDGELLIRELQPEGKKRMSADAFLRGYHLEPGTVLGE